MCGGFLRSFAAMFVTIGGTSERTFAKISPVFCKKFRLWGIIGRRPFGHIKQTPKSFGTFFIKLNLARPSVIFKVSFFVWVFREHRGVSWEPPHVRVRKSHLFIGRIHSKTRENKCHFSEKPLGTPLEAIEFLFFCAKGVPQEHGKKWHPESDTWTR